jgi:vacuolar protein sorting-associated protein 13A/C
MEITMKLEDVIVTDLNPRTIHPNILSIVGGDALRVRLVIYDLEQTANYNSDNMMIDVSMGCAKIIFMNWFVTSVLSFLDHFQTAQERIKEASKAAAEAAKQSAVQAYEQATRIRIGVKIKAPIILVPVHSQSCEAILIDLGNLKVSNFIKSIDVQNEHGPALIDEMKVELTDAKLSKVQLHADSESSATNTSSRFQSQGKKSFINSLIIAFA